MSSPPPSEERIRRRVVKVLSPHESRLSFADRIYRLKAVLSLSISFLFFLLLLEWNLTWVMMMFFTVILGAGFLYLGFFFGYQAVESVLTEKGVKAFNEAFPDEKHEEREMAIDILNTLGRDSIAYKVMRNLPEISMRLYRPKRESRIPDDLTERDLIEDFSAPDGQTQRRVYRRSYSSSNGTYTVETIQTQESRTITAHWPPTSIPTEQQSHTEAERDPINPETKEKVLFDKKEKYEKPKKAAFIQLETNGKLEGEKKKKTGKGKSIQLEPEKLK